MSDVHSRLRNMQMAGGGSRRSAGRGEHTGKRERERREMAGWLASEPLGRQTDTRNWPADEGAFLHAETPDGPPESRDIRRKNATEKWDPTASLGDWPVILLQAKPSKFPKKLWEKYRLLRFYRSLLNWERSKNTVEISLNFYFRSRNYTAVDFSQSVKAPAHSNEITDSMLMFDDQESNWPGASFTNLACLEGGKLY